MRKRHKNKLIMKLNKNKESNSRINFRIEIVMTTILKNKKNTEKELKRSFHNYYYKFY